MVPGTQKDLTRPDAPTRMETKNGRAVCPICGRPTPLRILRGTILVEFPLYCKHCRRTTLVSYREPELQSLSL